MECPIEIVIDFDSLEIEIIEDLITIEICDP